MIHLLFVLLPDTLLLDLAGPAEAFRLANRHLQQHKRPAAFDLQFVSSQEAQSSSVGLALQRTGPLPITLAGASWVVLMGQSGERFTSGRSLRDPAWLQTRHWLTQHGADLLGTDSPHRLLTVCGGALLAADAGLLNGRRCTTHHELLETLQRQAPTAEVVNNRVFVIDGPVATSAGVTAGIDLALQLIANQCGEDIAASVAQDMVVYLRRGPRDPELSPLLQHRNHLHPAVHRVQDAVIREPTQLWRMGELAHTACVTERHLLRLFNEHAGVSPLHYVESIRLEHARRALQTGASVSQAAGVSGFSSDVQLRRAWGRRLGGTPSSARPAA